MSQVDTNTSDIKTLKDQMVAVNTNIDSISNNQKQQKNISSTTGKDINNPPPVPSV